MLTQSVLRMQLDLSEGQEAEDKRVGYKRALARAYVHSGQPDKAIPYLQELVGMSTTPAERLELLCSLADAEASLQPIPHRLIAQA